MSHYIIYQLSCKDTDKKYIGQTTHTLHERIQQHKEDFGKYVKSLELGICRNTCRALYNDIRIYGFETIEYSQIDSTDIDQEDADRLETHYIREYNTLYPNGYNLTTGGKTGFTYCEDSRQYRSQQTREGVINHIDNHRTNELSKGLPPYVQYSEFGDISRFLIKKHPLCASKEFRVGSQYATIDNAKRACLEFLEEVERTNVKYQAPKKGIRNLPKGIIVINGGYRVSKSHKGERPMKDFTNKNKSDDENYDDAINYYNELLIKWNL